MFGLLASLWRRQREPRTRPHVLYIDDWFPDPRIGAGAPRALSMLHAITAAVAAVTLFPTQAEPEDADVIQRQLPGCDVVLCYGANSLEPFLRQRAAQFALIMVSRPHNMANFRAAASTCSELAGVPVVYDAEALFATREVLKRAVLGQPVSADDAARMIADELALAAGTRMVLAVNPQTADAFKSAGHGDVRVLRHAVAPRPTPAAFAARAGILFVGPILEGAPNEDAVVWFIDHVLPEVWRAAARQIPLTLVGNQRSRVVTERVAGPIRSLGVVADLGDVYSAARVFVAPTRFSSGIPLKVYDAAAHGVPVVMSALLAEQLDWRHEQEALVATSPQDFATQCLRLYDDRALWESIRAKALKRVVQDCNPSRFNRAVAKVLQQALDHAS